MTLPSINGIFKAQTIMTLIKRDSLGNSLKILLGSLGVFIMSIPWGFTENKFLLKVKLLGHCSEM